MNLQTPTKRSVSNGETLLVHSIFNTIQGEGPYVGQPACFVRLAGCNLQCPQCDTEYTANAQERTVQLLVDEIVEQFRHELIVITGGEPFRQNIMPFVDRLIDRDFIVQVETNGTFEPQGVERLYQLAWNKKLCVVCSPKTGNVSVLLAQLVRLNGAYKYVTNADDLSATDGLPVTALGHPASPQLYRSKKLQHFPDDMPEAPIYLQPANFSENEFGGDRESHDGEWEATGQYKRNLAACIKSCERFGYRLSLQTHKYIGVE